MIVKHSDLSKNLKANTNFFLLYGSNTGLVDETINNILIPNFGNNIFNYDEGELILNTSDFEESIYNKSFFDDDKLIIINRCTDKILEIVKNLITKKFQRLQLFLNQMFWIKDLN